MFLMSTVRGWFFSVALFSVCVLNGVNHYSGTVKNLHCCESLYCVRQLLWVIIFFPALLWNAPVSYCTSEGGHPDQNVTWKRTSQFERVVAWPCSLPISGRGAVISCVPCKYLYIREYSCCNQESSEWRDWSAASRKGNILVSILLLTAVWAAVFQMSVKRCVQ
jgi:hypothetical protein